MWEKIQFWKVLCEIFFVNQNKLYNYCMLFIVEKSISISCRMSSLLLISIHNICYLFPYIIDVFWHGVRAEYATIGKRFLEWRTIGVSDKIPHIICLSGPIYLLTGIFHKYSINVIRETRCHLRTGSSQFL